MARMASNMRSPSPAALSKCFAIPVQPLRPGAANAPPVGLAMERQLGADVQPSFLPVQVSQIKHRRLLRGAFRIKFVSKGLMQVFEILLIFPGEDDVAGI